MRWLVVDDEPSIGWALGRLAGRMGHEAVAVASVEEALRVDGERVSLIVLDVRLPGESGLSALPKLRSRYGDVPVIVITGYGDLSTAVDAVQGGAFEYLIKPFDLDTIERILQRAMERPGLNPVPAEASRGDEPSLLGSSPAMQTLFKQLALAASSEATVHVVGETGTGKELVARGVHRFSRRRGGPFVAVHVAGLSETLIESELFGHVRGAFTGATENRRGLLEQAQGGTVFLDEVAEIPSAVQAKLLRVLETREVIPVGSNEPRRVDFRLVSATHRDLQERARAGAFREDLVYRLDGFRLMLPPLRERGEDVILLAEQFALQAATRHGVAAPRLSPHFQGELRQRGWPGNVRQLQHAIEHAVIVSRGGTLLPEHLPSEGGETSSDDLPARIERSLAEWARQACRTEGAQDVYERMLELVEPPVLSAAMDARRGQLSAAAQLLGLHRMTLRKKLGRSRPASDE